jgi:hypothetical protein
VQQQQTMMIAGIWYISEQLASSSSSSAILKGMAASLNSIQNQSSPDNGDWQVNDDAPQLAAVSPSPRPLVPGLACNSLHFSSSLSHTLSLGTNAHRRHDDG